MPDMDRLELVRLCSAPSARRTFDFRPDQRTPDPEARKTAHPGLRSIRLNGEGQKRPPKPARFRGEIDPLHVPDRNQADDWRDVCQEQDPGGAPGHLGTSFVANPTVALIKSGVRPPNRQRRRHRPSESAAGRGYRCRRRSGRAIRSRRRLRRGTVMPLPVGRGVRRGEPVGGTRQPRFSAGSSPRMLPEQAPSAQFSGITRETKSSRPLGRVGGMMLKPSAP